MLFTAAVAEAGDRGAASSEIGGAILPALLQPGLWITVIILGTGLGLLTVYLLWWKRRHASALKASRDIARALLNASLDPTFLLDTHWNIVAVNDSAIGSIGLRSHDILGKNFFEFFPSDVAARRRERVEQVIRHGKPLRFVDSFEGRYYEHSMYPVLQNSGLVSRVAVSTRDVTRRKLMESTLRSTNRFLRQLLESSKTIAIISVSGDGSVLYWNAGAENLLGYSSDEMVGKRKLQDIAAVQDISSDFSALLVQVLERLSVVTREIALYRKNGEQRWLRITCSPQREAEGGVLAMLIIGEDVTEVQASRREREEATEQLRLLASTLNCAQDAFVITDMNNTILYVNQSFLNAYGYDDGELVGKDISLVRSSSMSTELAEQIRKGTQSGGWTGEIVNRRKTGEEFPVELWTSVVRDSSGEPLALVGVARDITERKRTEGQITSSLREKEALLKEVHHRVKNNLQVISSILSLQAEKVTNDDILAILRESQNRIRSMALVHEELYQSEGFSSIDIGDYIRRLSNALLHGYPFGESVVTLTVEVGDIYMPVDEVAPCGLIINELISNALKHAFVGRKRGKISVSFQRVGSDYVLMIADNGIGFPKEIDYRRTESLGLQLVDALTHQLRGTLTMERRRGTTFTLTFPVPVPPGR